MRKFAGYIPDPQEADLFGQHAVKLLKRALEIGYDAAIHEELASPTWDDPDWCRMIVARSQGQVPVFQADDSVTFRCHKCLDTGLIELAPVLHFGAPCRSARWCDPCPWRLWARAQWLKKQEAEGARRGGRLRDGLD